MQDGIERNALALIEARCPAAAGLWDEACAPDRLHGVPTQDLCDVVYALYFLGWPRRPTARGLDALCEHVRRLSTAARILGNDDGAPLGVHGTAYLLGALTLLSAEHPGVLERALDRRHGWRAGDLLDPATARPLWPERWSQHSWRVSHWIGGACAICALLEAHAPDAYRANGFPPSAAVLDQADRLIEAETGFLRCYGRGAAAALAHRLFNALYALRHDPVCAEIGGVVHVHWVNYFSNRPIKSSQRLFAAAARKLCEKAPFIEGTPYCLDFDLVQIVRVIRQAERPNAPPGGPLEERMGRYARDLAAFLSAPPPPGYTLHRLPGALAALHECLLFLQASGLPPGDGLAVVQPRDVMRDVAWL